MGMSLRDDRKTKFKIFKSNVTRVRRYVAIRLDVYELVHYLKFDYIVIIRRYSNSYRLLQGY